MRNLHLPLVVAVSLASPPAVGRPDDAATGAAPPRTVLIEGRRLVEARRQIAAGDRRAAAALKRLRARADRELQTPVASVVDKPAPPPGGDQHDYLSLSPYWWPDPDAADGRPYIRRDGRINPEAERFDQPKLAQFSRTVPMLSLAFALTGHEPYAARAARHLRAWFLDPETRMNPHLNHGQFIPGRVDGRHDGIIETHGLIRVVDAVALLEGSPAWTEKDAAGVRDWFRDYLSWLRESPFGRDEVRAANNHGSWYDAQVAAFALFVGEDRMAREVLESAKERRIARQIEPDGRQPRELARTKSFHYSLFNLEALVALATLGDRAGVDLWHHRTPDGRSLRVALDWIIPYATGEKPWTHPQITELEVEPLLPLLRRAAIAYRAPAYERILQELMRRGERLSEAVELLEPPADTEDAGG